MKIIGFRKPKLSNLEFEICELMNKLGRPFRVLKQNKGILEIFESLKKKKIITEHLNEEGYRIFKLAIPFEYIQKQNENI